MAVRYRYNNQASWTYVGGDRFEFKEAGAKCIGLDISPRVYFYGKAQSSDGGISFNNFGSPNSALELVCPKNSDYVGLKTYNSGYIVAAECETPTGQIVLSSGFDSRSFGGSPYKWAEVELARVDYWFVDGGGGFKINPATFNLSNYGGSNRNLCLLSSCNFKVFSGQQLLLNLTQATCPQAEVVQGCPPDTCDVLCGDTICCYNSEGISIFSYPNV